MTPHVDQLSSSFNNFLDVAKSDNKVSTKADIEIITFSDNARIANSWSNIGGVPYQHFTAAGMTNMRDAMILAKEEARSRTKSYKDGGIRAYKPWIVLMTDGYPDGDKPIDSIAAELRQREIDGKVHVWALGMGTDFNKKTLDMFTDKTFAITNWNFETFFSWLGKSVAVVSHSTLGTTGQLCDTGNEFQTLRQDYNKFTGTL
jgi:uncharacterized protein YegL